MSQQMAKVSISKLHNEHTSDNLELVSEHSNSSLEKIDDRHAASLERTSHGTILFNFRTNK